MQQPYYGMYQPTPRPEQYPVMYNQNIQQPYMDRLSQLQAMQQSMQPQQFPSLNGRIVDSLENIMASDVPMDGNFAIFPKRDMSEICVKYWTGEGKIATISFKPSASVSGKNISQDTEIPQFAEFNSALEGLHKKIDDLSARFDDVVRNRNGGKPRKEVTGNE